MKKTSIIIISIFITSLALIFFINKLTPKIIENKTSYEIRQNISNKERVVFLPLLNFDGRNYFDLADRGYFYMDNWWKKAFYPMYPLLIYIVTALTGVKLIYSGLIISWISILLGFFYLYKLVELDYGKSIAMRTLFLVGAFPTSFYFYSYYTESLFFLLSVLCFYNIRLKNYYIASIIAAFASGTRVVGMYFFLYLLYLGIKDYSERKKFPFYVLIAPLGLTFFMMYFYLNNDSPLAMFSGQLYWGKSFNIVGSITVIYVWISEIYKSIFISKINPHSLAMMIMELVSYLLSLLFIIFSYKKLRIDYWIYILLSVFLAVTATSLSSLPRYLLVLFPIQIFFAKYLRKRWYYLLLAIYIVILLYFETLFIRGYWVA